MTLEADEAMGFVLGSPYILLPQLPVLARHKTLWLVLGGSCQPARFLGGVSIGFESPPAGQRVQDCTAEGREAKRRLRQRRVRRGWRELARFRRGRDSQALR